MDRNLLVKRDTLSQAHEQTFRLLFCFLGRAAWLVLVRGWGAVHNTALLHRTISEIYVKNL